MLGETPCFGDGFELPVNVLRVTLLSNTNTAYDYYVMLRINAVNDAMVAELVFPISRERAPQRESVAFGIDGELLLQNSLQLVSDAAVQGFYVRCGV